MHVCVCVCVYMYVFVYIYICFCFLIPYMRYKEYADSVIVNAMVTQYTSSISSILLLIE